jgi:two-component system cell cycle response regulator DivK
VPLRDDIPAPDPTKRILIVEDNPLNMKLLCDLLALQAYRVLAAADGATGLRLARGESPDLILLDLRLPDLSGYEVVRQLRGDGATATIPVIAVTAFAMAGDEARALASGFDAFVTKPFRVRELLELVANFLGMTPPGG